MDMSDDEREGRYRPRERFERERSSREQSGSWDDRRRRRSRSPHEGHRKRRRPVSPHGWADVDRKDRFGRDYSRSYEGGRGHYSNDDDVPIGDDGPPMIPLEDQDFLVSFDFFRQWYRSTTRHRPTDQEYQTAYDEYKRKFEKRQLSVFYNQHKDDVWFKDLYDQERRNERKTRLDELKRSNFDRFLDHLSAGKLDHILLEKSAMAKKSDSKVDDQPGLGVDEPSAVAKRLYIKTIPPRISFSQLESACQEMEGFEYLALSAPYAQKNYHRVGWIVFKDGTDMEAALEHAKKLNIDNFTFFIGRDSPQLAQAPRWLTGLAAKRDRLEHDLKQAQRVAEQLDAEVGLLGVDKVIERAKIAVEDFDADLDTDVYQRLALAKELDLVLEYLRRVHFFCYYCASTNESAEELQRRCPWPHYRLVKDDDDKSARSTEPKNIHYLQGLDAKIALLFDERTNDKITAEGGRLLEDALLPFIREHSAKEGEDEYKCTLANCTKAFVAEEYLVKHVRSKHPDEIADLVREVETFNNYVFDPNHLTPEKERATKRGKEGNQPPMPTPFMPMPMPPGVMPFAMPGFAPFRGFPMPGFDMEKAQAAWAAMMGNVGISARNGQGSGRGRPQTMPTMPGDPRQMKSYRDLDDPSAEADDLW